MVLVLPHLLFLCVDHLILRLQGFNIDFDNSCIEHHVMEVSIWGVLRLAPIASVLRHVVDGTEQSWTDCSTSRNSELQKNGRTSDGVSSCLRSNMVVNNTEVWSCDFRGGTLASLPPHKYLQSFIHFHLAWQFTRGLLRISNLFIPWVSTSQWTTGVTYLSHCGIRMKLQRMISLRHAMMNSLWGSFQMIIGWS